jgi:hypothetical protein
MPPGGYEENTKYPRPQQGMAQFTPATAEDPAHQFLMQPNGSWQRDAFDAGLRDFG